MSMAVRALECARKSLIARTAFNLFLQDKEKTVRDGGHDFTFHYFDTSVYDRRHPYPARASDPLLPPYPAHTHVARLTGGADHHVFINLFMVAPGHVVISSADPSHAQGDDLNGRDCAALSQVIRGFGRRGIAYYNSGWASGCSQPHKHMQFAPLLRNPLFSAMRSGARLPFRYFAAELGDDSPAHIERAYCDLMARARHCGAYNFMIADGAAVLVPRRRAAHELGISVNSLGVAGHFFLFEDSSPRIERMPLRILTDLCVEVQ